MLQQEFNGSSGIRGGSGVIESSSSASSGNRRQSECALPEGIVGGSGGSGLCFFHDFFLLGSLHKRVFVSSEFPMNPNVIELPRIAPDCGI